MDIVKIYRLQRMLPQSTRRLLADMLRTFTTSSWVCANHYDELEITPKATQGDIKSAYYKLSKKYHPDKSDDETSAKKFRAITAAYEVLGNIKLKKMYDKGLLVGRDNVGMEYRPEPEPEDPTLKFYKAHPQRHVAPTIDGRTPIYNFDSWSRNHYGEVFEKAKYDRELLKKKKQKQEDIRNANSQEALVYLIIIMGGLFIVLVAQGKADYDRDMIAQKKGLDAQQNQSKE